MTSVNSEEALVLEVRIAARPSNLISKVAHILAWFEKYDGEEESEAGARCSSQARVSVARAPI